MVERKSKAGLSKHLAHHTLTAACLAAGLAIAGCDAGTDTTARQDAEKASRLAASAGQPRATEKLADKVAGTPIDEKTLHVDPASYKEYVKQDSTVQDLVSASSAIKKVLGGSLNSGLKSVIQAQDGTISLALAGERLQIAQSKLNDLAHKAVVLQGLASEAADLGRQADALKPYTAAPATADLDKAKASLGERNSTVAAAQAAVDSIQKDIAAKQEQAKGIFASTEADFKAADALKGQAAIDAGSKAMETRKQGDELLAQAVLEPALAKAKSDLQVATIQQTSTQHLIDTLSKSLDAQRTQVKQTTETIATLREQAKKMVQDSDGVSESYKKLLDDAAALDADLKSALSAARDAESAFKGASMELNTNLRALSDLANTLQVDKSDPLSKAAAEKRVVALLNCAQSSAAESTGRINATGYTAASILATVNGQVASAFKGANLTNDLKPNMNAADYRDAAQKAFTNAAASAKNGTDSITDADRLKWIGYGLQAISQQGLSLVADKRDADAARAAAKAAGTRAMEINPDMKTDMQRLAIGI